MSFLGRKYGLSANNVRSIELVTADSRLVRTDPETEPDLFWALRGGGGSFGVVTAIELSLFPITEAYAGILWYPIQRGDEVLQAWRELTQADPPDELTTVGRFLKLPPIPEIPEPVRGKSFVVVEAYHVGDPRHADELLAPLRRLGPVNDTIAVVPMPALSHSNPQPFLVALWRLNGRLAAILGGVRLPRDEAGSGPAVVLLHAGVADRRMWAEHLPVFADAGCRAIALDLPGFGDAAASGEITPWSDVLETLDAIGVGRFAAVGNSFGAAVALRVAVCAPQRVAALVLVSVPPPELKPSRELEAAWEAEEAALTTGDIDAAVSAVLDAWTLPQDASVRERIARMQRRAFELQAAAGELTEAEDPLTLRPGALTELDVPVLIVAGEFDMPDFRQGAEPLARQLRAAPPVSISGAGHLAPMEQPARFRQLVLDFLGQSGVAPAA